MAVATQKTQADPIRQFSIFLANKAGRLLELIRILQSRHVHVVALTILDTTDSAIVRMVVDDPAAAMAVLSGLRMIFEETEAALVRLPHRPGELGRAASLLGENRINIHYSYCGLEPGSTKALVVFGVDNLTRAANMLDAMAGE